MFIISPHFSALSLNYDHLSTEQKKKTQAEKNQENFEQGYRQVWQHPMFYISDGYTYWRERHPYPGLRGGLVVVSDQGMLYVNENTEASPAE